MLERLNPSVPVSVLYFLAGFSWSLVGIMLCLIPAGWISTMSRGAEILIVLSGMAASGAIAVFGFSRVARRNIARIAAYGERACLFAFQSWKSYLNIAVMIGLGWLLRHSPIPKYALAPLYFGIGGALFASSFLYYIRIASRSRSSETR